MVRAEAFNAPLFFIRNAHSRKLVPLVDLSEGIKSHRRFTTDGGTSCVRRFANSDKA